MDVQTISKEIVDIRSRLREIESQRQKVPADDLETKTELHDEEIGLRSRLAQLQEMATEKENSSEDANGEKGEFVTPPDG